MTDRTITVNREWFERGPFRWITGHRVTFEDWGDPNADGSYTPRLGVDQNDCLLGPEKCGIHHLTPEEIAEQWAGLESLWAAREAKQK